MDVDDLAEKFALQYYVINKSTGKFMSPKNLATEAYSYANALVDESKINAANLNRKETPPLDETKWTPMENV